MSDLIHLDAIKPQYYGLKKVKSLDQGSNDIYYFLYFLNIESFVKLFLILCLFLLLCIQKSINIIYIHS